MKIAFIRYRYLEKLSIFYRITSRFLPKGLMKEYFLRKRRLKRRECTEGEFRGMEVELPFNEYGEQRIGKDTVWSFLEEDIREQKRLYGNTAILLKGELFLNYCKRESNFSCYPYEANPCLTCGAKEEISKLQGEYSICNFFRKRNYMDWLKLFFVKELTEYYRSLYGIRKKLLKLVIVEGELEETKRVIKVLSKDLNYMIVKTKNQEMYDSLAREIYEETGLSIIFLDKEDHREEEVFKKLEGGESQKAVITVDLTHLYPKATNIRITQRGIWVDQEVLVAVLMEQAMNFDGRIVEEKFVECKEEYGLYLRKIV